MSRSSNSPNTTTTSTAATGDSTGSNGNKKWDAEFERQVQELASLVMFPAMSCLAVLIHLTLVYFCCPRSSWHRHFQIWLVSLFVAYWLWCRDGLIMRRVHSMLSVRTWTSLGCLVAYFGIWLMAAKDGAMLTDAPGPRVLGALFGTLMGAWLGLVATSAADYLDYAKKNGLDGTGSRLPANRAERRRLERQTLSSAPSKKRT